MSTGPGIDSPPAGRWTRIHDAPVNWALVRAATLADPLLGANTITNATGQLQVVRIRVSGVLMNCERLADDLIALQCSTHSLGRVYEFLLKTYGDAKRAKADFVRFLSGELPDGLVEEAELWVAEEQGIELMSASATLPQHSAYPANVVTLVPEA